jgi:hypothetical protein
VIDESLKGNEHSDNLPPVLLRCVNPWRSSAWVGAFIGGFDYLERNNEEKKAGNEFWKTSKKYGNDIGKVRWYDIIKSELNKWNSAEDEEEEPPWFNISDENYEGDVISIKHDKGKDLVFVNGENKNIDDVIILGKISEKEKKKTESIKLNQSNREKKISNSLGIKNGLGNDGEFYIPLNELYGRFSDIQFFFYCNIYFFQFLDFAFLHPFLIIQKKL